MIRHQPVLAGRIAELLAAPGPGTWVDCTLGDGGHSEAFLRVLDGSCRVVGLDRDTEALAVARNRLGGDPRFSCIHTPFSALASFEETDGAKGFLFDFGVSSRQLDEDHRGFTIRPGVPLDLRMDREDPRDLRSILTATDPDELGNLLAELADVPRSRIVCRHLAKLAAERDLTSDDLEAALLEAFPRGMRDRPREMARLSMALRMVVNSELDEIRTALPAAFSRLAPGGRLAVLTYHSVEDRLAKGILRKLIGDDADAPRDIYGNRPAMQGSWVARREDPSKEEVASNPRARSAQLRVVEKRRGAALAGVLGLLLAIGLVGTVMVGCVWRQTRHVELEKGLGAARDRERKLSDSVAQVEARIRSERQPAVVGKRAAALGYARPERQFRLVEPDTAEVRP
ncbi:MAG TPA: 16S rRNA (cytosine(1402)-N(4))-methyltransferase RsmH [Fibrobacteria bacterium]|nr:16S rRNA (cytosine(1402)-N(4))-methyltransferase RsmH [Fibrobacteria bacterium]